MSIQYNIQYNFLSNLPINLLLQYKMKNKNGLVELMQKIPVKTKKKNAFLLSKTAF